MSLCEKPLDNITLAGAVYAGKGPLPFHAHLPPARPRRTQHPTLASAAVGLASQAIPASSKRWRSPRSGWRRKQFQTNSSGIIQRWRRKQFWFDTCSDPMSVSNSRPFLSYDFPAKKSQRPSEQLAQPGAADSQRCSPLAPCTSACVRSTRNRQRGNFSSLWAAQAISCLSEAQGRRGQSKNVAENPRRLPLGIVRGEIPVRRRKIGQI